MKKQVIELRFLSDIFLKWGKINFTLTLFITKTNLFNNQLEITMAYVLEEITPADQEKIIREFTGNEMADSYLNNAIREGMFPETWAIDYEKNNYLFHAPPILIRPEIAIESYFAHINKAVYKIYASALQVYFDKHSMPLELISTELQDEIKAAFQVYGQWGTGPGQLNKQGIPVNSVNPITFSIFGD